jgi:hypothetical protein
MTAASSFPWMAEMGITIGPPLNAAKTEAMANSLEICM